PFLSTLPTDSLARTSGVRSGLLYSSMGVGTVTMNTRQLLRSLSSVVKRNRAAAFSSARVVSSVLSLPASSSAIRAFLTSNPTVSKCLPNSTARGRPTYPRPTMPMRHLRRLSTHFSLLSNNMRGGRGRPQAPPAARFGYDPQHHLVRIQFFCRGHQPPQGHRRPDERAHLPSTVGRTRHRADLP